MGEILALHEFPDSFCLHGIVNDLKLIGCVLLEPLHSKGHMRVPKQSLSHNTHVATHRGQPRGSGIDVTLKHRPC